jgi:opacity protein-like surface antigen
MKRALLAALALCAIAAAAPAAATVTGNWTMAVEGGPHGNATMGLSLKQEGDKVSGTFASGHSADMAVAGEFVKGELKLATTAGGADDKILFSAKLKEDGTLAGYISSPMGDMKWTASRVEAKEKK